MIFDKEILTVTEAAYYLACGQQMIYGLIKQGNLEAYKAEGRAGRRGRIWKISAFSVDYYLRSMMCKYTPEKSHVTISKK